MKMSNTKFIVFEGIDGCGKETQMFKVAQYIYQKNKRYNISLTREPTYGKYGIEARKILQTETDPLKGAEKCLEIFKNDGKDHDNFVIKDTRESDLKMGGDYTTIILKDRISKYGRCTYQVAQGINIEKAVEMSRKEKSLDLAIIYDLSAEEAAERQVSRDSGVKEKFEQINFQKKVRENYLNLPKLFPEDNIKIINANPSLDEIIDYLRLKPSLKTHKEASIEIIFNQAKKYVDEILPF
jgi:dTMP kinase